MNSQREMEVKGAETPQRPEAPIFYSGASYTARIPIKIEIKKSGQEYLDKYHATIEVGEDYIGSIWFDDYEIDGNTLWLIKGGRYIACINYIKEVVKHEDY